MDKKKIGIFIGIIVLIVGVVYFAMSNHQNTSFDSSKYPNEQIAILEEFIQNNPDDIEGWQQLALQYSFIGDYRRVGEIHQGLIDKDPTNNIHRINLGTALLDAGRLEEAAIAYRTVLEYNKKEMNVYSSLLDIYSDLDKMDEIREVIVKLEEIEADIVNINAEDDQAVGLLARAYKILGENEKAIEYYQKMLDEELGVESVLKEQIEELKK